MGVLYAEGRRRYMSALSTYTRRRLGQPARLRQIQSNIFPSAIALRQRPVVPGNSLNSHGTATEALNVIPPHVFASGPCLSQWSPRSADLDIAKGMDLPNDGESGMGMITSPTCGVHFMAFAAEDFAF